MAEWAYNPITGNLDIIGEGGGVIPPEVPEQFVTDNGTAIPVLNSLNVNGGSSSINNDNGIEAQANPNLGDNIDIVLTNRLIGAATSINASTENLITFPLANVEKCYRLECFVTGRDTVTGDGIGYTVLASARTDGINAAIIATPFVDNDEDASLVTASITLIALGNDIIVQVTGVTSQTIVYKCLFSYIEV